MFSLRRGLLALTVLSVVPSVVRADWPWTAEGPRRGSEEYYYARTCEPVGERQKCKHGRLWPPFARPTGEEQTWVHKYHALHYWPWPYNLKDRDDVRLVMQTQAANGWLTATTMYDYHFDPVSHQLNSAGIQHLAWIFNQAPPAYRHVYISAPSDPSFVEARTSSVQKTLTALAGSESAMQVTMRTTDPLGRPATEVQQIFEATATNALPPKIEYQAVGSASGN